MPNPRLAGRYAKSLVDLAQEKGQLEGVFQDMQYLQAVCKASKDFTNVLRSPIIKGDKKESILNAVIKGNISEISAAFIKLLIVKGRERDLPEIADAFVEQYYALKNIQKVKLTTAVPVSDGLKKSIADKIVADNKLANVEMETLVDESLIGGFTIEFNNNLLDASIKRDLHDIKKQFSINLFESKIS